MTTNTRLAVLIYAMIQGILFGVPTVIVLATPALAGDAATYLPWIVALSFLAAVPTALIMAPWLKARRELRDLPTHQGADTRTDIGLAQAAPRRGGSFADRRDDTTTATPEARQRR